IDLVMRSTVLDNVLHGTLGEVDALSALLGRYGVARRRRACALLQRVGLTEAQLYRRASELSGGQQQRVGVARAFMKDPQLVLADEPVASLDPRTSREILALLREAAREKQVTVLCSLHDVTLAREFADRIVAMRAGRVVLDRAAKDFDSAVVEHLYAAAA
ncbi:MAG TPA: ATP-binding cassette domain-containing protein, partial [Steroidobacteraceae bacterium]|nr:ATP-binding cassette domain-containing protein [Steroidobacteraceae bacterium]